MELIELLALYGSILSTILLSYELYKFVYLERPRLKVETNIAIIATPIQGGSTLKVLSASAINIGRRPITLQSCGIHLDNGMNITWLTTRDDFPKQLDESQSMTNYRELREVKRSLDEARGKPIYFWYRDATGKEHKAYSGYTKRLLTQILEGKLQ